MIRRLVILMTVATVLLAACSSGGGTPAAPALTDPKDILTKSVLSLKDVKSFHLHGELTGTLNMDLTGTGSPSALNLVGTNADGDIDIANKKIKISFAAPAFLGVTGEIIVIDKTSYTKVSLLGPKYQKSVSTDGDDPTSVATDPQKTIDEINGFLTQPGVAPTKEADEKCGDKDCYHVKLNLTSDQLSGVTGGLGTDAPTGTGTVDIWVQKGDLRPAKITVSADAGTDGTIGVTLTFSNYDGAVTIEAPPDSEVEAEAALRPAAN